MNYDVTKDNLSARELVFEGCREVPVDLDFSLPEYCPDMKKILKCKLQPNITSRNISGDRLNVEGMTKIRVIYSDAENNRIRCCENSVPFSCSVDIRSNPENAFAITSSRVEYVNCRAVSPRKLDIHGAFSMCSKIYVKKSLEISSGVSGNDTEQKTTKLKMNNLIGIGQQQFSLNETLELGENRSSPETILNSDVSLRISEYKNMSNKTVLKGEAVIKILYIDDLSTGHTETLEYTIPVSQIVDVPGITEDSTCVVDSEVIMHDEQICNENGENSNFINSEIKIVATVMAFNNKDISIVSDVYSTEYDVDVMKDSIKMEQLSEIVRDNFSHKDTVNLSDANVSKLIDAWSDTCSVNPHFEEENIVFKCKMNICILALDNENIPMYIERILEFEHSKPFDSNPSEMVCEIKMLPGAINCSLMGSNSIEIKINPELFGEIYVSKKQDMVISVMTDETSAVPKDDASLTVYYASAGEDIWDIARKYYTCAEMIKRENDISEDKVKNSGMLLIPMK